MGTYLRPGIALGPRESGFYVMLAAVNEAGPFSHHILQIRKPRCGVEWCVCSHLISDQHKPTQTQTWDSRLHGPSVGLPLGFPLGNPLGLLNLPGTLESGGRYPPGCWGSRFQPHPCRQWPLSAPCPGTGLHAQKGLVLGLLPSYHCFEMLQNFLSELT